MTLLCSRIKPTGWKHQLQEFRAWQLQELDHRSQLLKNKILGENKDEKQLEQHSRSEDNRHPLLHIDSPAL